MNWPLMLTVDGGSEQMKNRLTQVVFIGSNVFHMCQKCDTDHVGYVLLQAS